MCSWPWCRLNPELFKRIWSDLQSLITLNIRFQMCCVHTDMWRYDGTGCFRSQLNMIMCYSALTRHRCWRILSVVWREKQHQTWRECRSFRNILVLKRQYTQNHLLAPIWGIASAKVACHNSACFYQNWEFISCNCKLKTS